MSQMQRRRLEIDGIYLENAGNSDDARCCCLSHTAMGTAFPNETAEDHQLMRPWRAKFQRPKDKADG